MLYLCSDTPLASKWLAVIVPLCSLAFKGIRFQVKLVTRMKPHISHITIMYDLKFLYVFETSSSSIKLLAVSWLVDELFGDPYLVLPLVGLKLQNERRLSFH